MPTHRKLLTAALCLPLLLSACNGKDSGSAGSSPTSPTPAGRASSTASATPSPTFSPGYPVASVYIMTARPDVTDQQLRDAIGEIGKLPGVISVSNLTKRQLRVEMSLTDLVKRARPVYDDLAKLGRVQIG